jgi:hypothetical protein
MLASRLAASAAAQQPEGSISTSNRWAWGPYQLSVHSHTLPIMSTKP